MTEQFAKTIVVTGHYGSGKTNLSLNLAMDFRRRGEDVILADLDIVNPYFRTAEFQEFAEKNGIDLLASDYAGPGTSLDIPALSGRLDAGIGGEKPLIIDIGGDDVGAQTLGRYAPRIEQTGYTMLYVINYYRYLMKEPEESVQLLRQIQTASRLRVTHIVNCSNLGLDTTPDDVRASMEYARRVAKLSELPVAMTVAHKEIVDRLSDVPNLFPVQVYVTAPWNR